MSRQQEHTSDAVSLIRYLRQEHHRNPGQPVQVDDQVWREVERMSPLARQTLDYLGIAVIRSSPPTTDPRPTRGTPDAPG